MLQTALDGRGVALAYDLRRMVGVAVRVARQPIPRDHHGRDADASVDRPDDGVGAATHPVALGGLAHIQDVCGGLVERSALERLDRRCELVGHGRAHRRVDHVRAATRRTLDHRGLQASQGVAHATGFDQLVQGRIEALLALGRERPVVDGFGGVCAVTFAGRPRLRD